MVMNLLVPVLFIYNFFCRNRAFDDLTTDTIRNADTLVRIQRKKRKKKMKKAEIERRGGRRRGRRESEENKKRTY